MHFFDEFQFREIPIHPKSPEKTLGIYLILFYEAPIDPKPAQEPSGFS